MFFGCRRLEKNDPPTVVVVVVEVVGVMAWCDCHSVRVLFSKIVGSALLSVASVSPLFKVFSKTNAAEVVLVQCLK